MHILGSVPRSGEKDTVPHGYEVEFYQAGEFVQMRMYDYGDEHMMLLRITLWIDKGVIQISCK